MLLVSKNVSGDGRTFFTFYDFDDDLIFFRDDGDDHFFSSLND